MSDLEVFGICIGFGVIAAVGVMCTYGALGLLGDDWNILDKILEKPAKFIVEFMDKKERHH